MNNTKKTMPEHLLTELQRQDVYLGELPDGYEFPVFSGKQAVESQRKSNYKTTAHAAREIVDNALEAGSSTVWIALQRVDEARRKKHQPRDTVTGVAFIDDGPGMKPNMARLALSWGGGTHAKEPNFIGKFGFGLPNSSINQTRRVEVYTKTAADRSWSMTYLDIHEVPQFGKVTVPEPVEAELPRFVLDYIERKKLTLDSGTIVAWVNPDRLSHSTSSNLRKALIEDFGVTYRYLLDEFSIIVEDVLVKPVDPLFLMEESLFFVPEEEGGAKCTFERELPVRYWRDRGTGAPRLEILEDSSAFYKRDDLHEDRLDVAIGSVRVRVARFPVGFVQGAKGASGDPKKRFEFRKGRKGLSFVRAGREIDTLDALPVREVDRSAGLGDWPTLQTYAYHWGIEVAFDPELDDAFGVGSDKQFVRPIEDFWRVMAQAEVDKAAKEETRYQTNARKRAQAERAQEEAQNPDRPNPASEAASRASKLRPKRELPDNRKKESQEVFEKQVAAKVKETGGEEEEVKQAIIREADRKRYKIDFFNAPGGSFYEPSFGNGLQRVAKVNKAHPFFEVFYTRLAQLEDPLARNAVDLLLMALADAELTASDDERAGLTVQEVYEQERKYTWTRFLDGGLKTLEGLEQSLEGEDE